jgi:hypothetical protein
VERGITFDNSIAGRIHETLPNEVELWIFTRNALISFSAVYWFFIFSTILINYCSVSLGVSLELSLFNDVTPPPEQILSLCKINSSSQYKVSARLCWKSTSGLGTCHHLGRGIRQYCFHIMKRFPCLCFKPICNVPFYCSRSYNREALG